MRVTAELFPGRHDWTAFSAAQSDAEDRMRTVTRLEITDRVHEQARSTVVEIRVSADGFLRYMVRAIAGALLAVGRAEIGGDEIREAIENGRRPAMAETAPACGLSLLSVRYDLGDAEPTCNQHG